jgi:FKBP-type peptidyl-prolyl cis-trans isomerase FklB
MKEKLLKHLKVIVYILLPLVGGGWLGAACSKNDATTDEHANWKERNDVFFASLEDSLARGIGTWRKLPSYSKTPKSNTDYVYVKVIPTGQETGQTTSPSYNDSVRLSYEGRLMPTAIPLTGKGFADGAVFDTTIFGSYNPLTNATVKFKVSALVNGLSTALLYMHRGDTWLVYIPYTLGYNDKADNTKIPAYSTLIFQVTLHDFATEGNKLPKM